MYLPTRCPNTDCSNHQSPSTSWFRRHGYYRPRCRSHAVPRFRCGACGATFSRQTFRADYRHKKPHINPLFFHLMVHCVGQRQCATILGVARRTVERRFVWLAQHARQFHDCQLRRARLSGPFQLDELESFEGNRFQPLTVPILIDRATFFLVASAVAPLRRKGTLSPKQREMRAAHEARHGRRPTRSSEAVQRVLSSLLTLVDGSVVVESDHKPSYQQIGRRLFGERWVGRRHDAKRRRDRRNPLFPINHTNARLRHFLSRLRRRSWCVSKRAVRLKGHLDIAALWVNYVRGITNRTKTTPAQALGISRRGYSIEEVLAWRHL